MIVNSVCSQDIMPFTEVRKGMTGVGKTVFSGTEVSEFSAEVVATFRNTGPGSNMILVEVSGGPLAETGVLAGMSGSPIYIDGKLIGALAYTWSFQKRALAGVTPVEEMLDLDNRISSQGSAFPGKQYTIAEFIEDRNSGNWSFALSPPVSGTGSNPILAPVVLGGFSRSFISEFENNFTDIGLLPVQGGSGTETTVSSPATLKPGDVLGVQLLRGDLEATAYGTVTHVTGNKVFGFGHPFLSAGPVSLPMVKGKIDALLPSNMISTKMGSAVAPAGTITKDGSSGVMGIAGEGPKMIPVRVGITRKDMEPSHFSFDCVIHENLTPNLIGMALRNIVAEHQKTSGYQTIVVDGTISLADNQDIRISDVFTGSGTAGQVSFLLSAYLNIIFNAGFEVPEIKGVSVYLDYSDTISAAELYNVSLLSDEVTAGEEVELELLLKPFRGEMIRKKTSFTVPSSLKGRKAILRVGDSGSISRFEAPPKGYSPASLDEVISLLNRQRLNNCVYITVSVNEPSYVIGGRNVGSLPPSVSSLLSSEKTSRGSNAVPTATVFESELATDYVMFGYHQILLEVN